MAKNFRQLSAKVKADPVRRARVEEHKRAMRDALALAALRDECGVTQQELAGKLGMSQTNVSRIERQDDLYLSTLGRYIAALGGHLDLTAVFPDRTVQITAVQN